MHKIEPLGARLSSTASAPRISGEGAIDSLVLAVLGLGKALVVTADSAPERASGRKNRERSLEQSSR
eukprot:7943753-Pyramimonas_sp.AAC.1